LKKINTDILIIGAGPAGCSAAQAAAQMKINTILIDRKKFPRDKTCGDGILFSSLKHLENLGFETTKIIDNPNLIHSKNMFFYDQNDESIEIENNLFFTFNRLDFDNLLLENLDSSVKKMEEAETTSIEKNLSGYLVKIKTPTENISIETNFIIGADGYSSFVRRNLFQELNIDKRIASRFYLKDSNFKSDAYHFYFNEKISPGYFWIFEVGKGEFNTGVYLPDNFASKDIFELHNYFIKKHFNREIDKNEFYTWPIPNNTDFTNLAKENAILIGDAAGLCDKLIGHGIDAAILSGILAIQSINFFTHKNEKKYPLQEIYRYNMSIYFKESLSQSSEVYNRIFTNKKESKQELIKYFKSVLP
jgi:geranylgeranyl reductase family protein